MTCQPRSHLSRTRRALAALAIGALTATAAMVYSAATATAATLQLTPINHLRGTGSYPKPLGSVGGKALISYSTDASGYELWVSDGTSSGTIKLTEIGAGTADGVRWDAEFVTAGGVGFFTGTDQQLWRTDGTVAGTYSLGLSANGVGSPAQLTAVGSTLVFLAVDGSGDNTLWKSDGSVAGTVRVSNPNENTDVIGEIEAFGANSAIFSLYFVSDLGTSQNELWITDLTSASTSKITSAIPQRQFEAPIYLTALGSKMLFMASPDAEYELWVTDGTAGGTSKLTDVVPADRPTTMNGVAYYRAQDGIQGEELDHELWRSDGSVGGTYRVKDINPGGGSNPTALTAWGDVLLFSANDGTTNDELWRSDGTTGGTYLVKEINTSSSPFIDQIAIVDGVPYFGAYDQTDDEIWTTDGTAAGTVLAYDVNADPLTGTEPSNLLAVGNTLFFAGAPSLYDLELYALKVVPPFECTAVATAKTVTFTATWSISPGTFITNVDIVNTGGTPVASKAGKSTSGAFTKTVRGISNGTGYACKFYSGNRRGDTTTLEATLTINSDGVGTSGSMIAANSRQTAGSSAGTAQRPAHRAFAYGVRL